MLHSDRPRALVLCTFAGTRTLTGAEKEVGRKNKGRKEEGGEKRKGTVRQMGGKEKREGR